MKRKFIISLIMISIVAVRLNVNAAATSAIPGDDSYTSLQSLYNSGISNIQISSSDWVTIYGKSDCDSNGNCVHSYVDGIKNGETILSKSVTCLNGQKYITYAPSISSGKMDSYKDASDNTLKSSVVYWSEVYYVTCTDDGTIPSANADTSNNDNINVENNYNTSTTVENEQTGVNTYFIVLGIVAIMSYGFMMFVKKFNLFKNI